MVRTATAITRFIDWFYIKPFQSVMSKQTFRYGVCGVFNMVVGWVLYELVYTYLFAAQNLELSFVVISPHVATLGICFPLTFSLGFILNKYVAFKSSPLRSSVQLMRYMLSVGGSLGLNYLLIKVFVEAFHIYPTFGQMISTIIITIYSYLMQKHFTFKGSVEE